MNQNEMCGLLFYFGPVVIVFVIVFVILTFVTIKDRKEAAKEPADDDFEHQVRIVELENGIFIIQVWQEWKRKWEAPFGPHHYDTLEAAKKEKERRVEELKRDAGYRFKRVVD
jgi:heme/copper-type cytochrome/quinol oxidase subunit 2